MIHHARARLICVLLLTFPALLVLQAGSVIAANRRVNVSSFSFAFDPATITVQVGDSVTWRTAPGDPDHTATSDTGAWDSGDIKPGGSKTVTFANAGTFGYHCRYHPIMKGTIVVRAAHRTVAGGLPQTDTSDSSAAAARGAGARLPDLLLLALIGLLGARLFLIRLDRGP